MSLPGASSTVAALDRATAAPYGQFGLALSARALLLAVGRTSYFVGRGRTLGWITLTACNVAFVALHIQLGRGTVEFHFGVFVLLGLLLVYRDWRPIALGAALFAVHPWDVSSESARASDDLEGPSFALN